uniref:PDZ domain-containing protein n=1 Tax=Salmonella enterica TaxID=28901 RepID=UPI0020C1CC63
WPIALVVEKGTPAYNAGLKAGDKIEAVNGTKTADWNNVVTEISGSKGKELKLEVSRSGKSETLSVTPKKMDGSYRVGIMQSMKTGFFDKIT